MIHTPTKRSSLRAHTRQNGARATAAALATSIVLAACSSAPRSRVDGDAQLPGDVPVEHAVHSAALRSTMVEIERLTLQQIPEDIAAGNSRSARLLELQEHADALARAAVNLPTFAGGFDSSSLDTPRFYDLADQLRRDAVALRDRAAAASIGSASEETERLLATCNACHAEFRLPPPFSAASGQ